MELIEQAVFMSAASDGPDGERRVVASPGVCEADARAIAAGSPTAESLVAPGADPVGLFFHPLPSGAHVVGRTAMVRRRPAESGAQRALTHCLVVRRRTLARFAGNPLAILRAAQTTGAIDIHEDLPPRLRPFPLEGQAAIVDTELLGRLRRYPGSHWMAALVQAAVDGPPTAVVDSADMEDVVAGVINCLPPECRMELSFSLGLRFSARRPHRLVALPGGTDEPQRIERLYNVAVLDLAGKPPQTSAQVGSWGSVVDRVLRCGHTSLFASQLAKRPLDFSPQDLPVLGLQMLESLDSFAVGNEDDSVAPAGEVPAIDEGWEARAGAGDAPDRRLAWPTDHGWGPPSFCGSRRHSHGSHPPRSSRAESAAGVASRPNPPSKDLDPNDPDVLAKLERLDDLVFDAISGNQASLDELVLFWPRVRSELEGPLLAESREQYLRYALMSWEKLAQSDGTRNPAIAMQSLEVLCVLFGGPVD